jgi:hypothetical protein
MYTLHAISLKFTENPCNFGRISPKIRLLHGFPTSNAGNPHSIPVKANSHNITAQNHSNFYKKILFAF